MNISITSEGGLSDQEKRELASIWAQLDETDRLKQFVNMHRHSARV